LGSLGGPNTFSAGYAISNAGQVAGSTDYAGTHSHAFLIEWEHDRSGHSADSTLATADATLKKAIWTAFFWRVGWDFRAALWAKSEFASHYRRVARELSF